MSPLFFSCVCGGGTVKITEGYGIKTVGGTVKITEQNIDY